MIKNNHLLVNNSYCACLAEGPGGFIHCINNYSNENDININGVFGITLISNDKSIPYWNQIITNNKVNNISNGYECLTIKTCFVECKEEKRSEFSLIENDLNQSCERDEGMILP